MSRAPVELDAAAVAPRSSRPNVDAGVAARRDWSPGWIVALAPGCSADASPAGSVIVRTPWSKLTLLGLPPVVGQALASLSGEGRTLGAVLDELNASGDSTARAAFFSQLRRLSERALLTISAAAPEGRLATLYCVSAGDWLRLADDAALAESGAESAVRLSRFALLRREGMRFQAETPLSACRVTLEDPRAAAAVASLAVPATASDLTERVADLPLDAASDLLRLLLAGDFLDEGDDANSTEQETRGALRSWSFHDLLFHSRTRETRGGETLGATFPRAALEPCPPALLRPQGEVIALPECDRAAIEAHDPPLAAVASKRRSIREYGANPLTIQQLGEFLDRVARVLDHESVEFDSPAGPLRMETLRRPYPSGGALHELEFYPVVAHCNGLEPGLYRYEAAEHGLERLAGRTPEVERLLTHAAGAIGVESRRLQVLIVLAARYDRLAWKYSGLPYALILKHVGVVYQSMYLAATAMNLAPCAAGAGDADAFARASGREYYEQCSVGEFLLGTRPDVG